MTQDPTELPVPCDVRTRTLSPWVTLVERELEYPGGDRRVYHSLRQDDYVAVLATTTDQRIPLVRQYRPAVQRVTLELPGGLVDGNEPPAAAARRELCEEAGLDTDDELVLLGTLQPDVGRLENRLWCFHAPNARLIPDWMPEQGVAPCLVACRDLPALISGGDLDFALHVAVIGLFLLRMRPEFPITNAVTLPPQD